MIKLITRAVAALFLAGSSAAYADITDQPFGPNQVFDVQYNWAHSSNPTSPDFSCYSDPSSCDVLNVSGLTTPYSSVTNNQPVLTTGQYYKFFNSTTVPGTYGLAVYNADGSQAFVMHNTGNFYKATSSGMFYEGGGMYGTVLSPSAGYAAGSSASLAVGTGAPTSADLSGYTASTTTVLAAGETPSTVSGGGSSGSGSGSGSTGGTPATGGLMTYIGGGTATVNFPTPVSTIDATGSYVRFGMNSLGTLGSGGSTTPGLLFDSTGTSTFNTSYDYLTPGSPFDGFTVKGLNADGTTHFEYMNNNQDLGWGSNPSNITGYLYDFSGVAYRGNTYDHRGVWIGEVPEFKIENDTYMNNSWMWINVDTRIEAKVAMPTLYFGRYIDPDAVAASGDSSQTDNALGYGVIPNTNVVFSEAQSSKYALGMYTAQAGNVGAGISSNWTTNPQDYFNGVNDGAGDYTIGLGFKMVGINVGDIVKFSYAYIFGPSAFQAGLQAINGGAAGGTPGTAGGCTSSCTLVDVGTASGGGSSAATIDHTNTTYERVAGTAVVDTSLPVITASITSHTASETAAVQTIARNSSINVTTAMRTPVAVTRVDTDVYTDGSTVERRTAQPTEYTLSNDVQSTTTSDTLNGRIDQYSVMLGANSNINRMMNHSLLRQDGIKYEHGTLYLNGGAVDSTSSGYNISSRQYGVAVDRIIRGDWILGVQYNNVGSTMNGVDSSGSMNKTHFGLYSLYRRDNTLLQTDLGIATNGYNVSRSIENEFNNASKTSGSDIWLSNRLYNTTKDNVRPFVGITVGRSTVDGYTETGSIQSARTVAGTSSNMNYAEAGVQLNKKFDKVNVFGELSATTDGFTTAALGAGYAVKENGILTATVSTHSKDGVTSNRITGGVKFRW
jgi:hypothetical protein